MNDRDKNWVKFVESVPKGSRILDAGSGGRPKKSYFPDSTVITIDIQSDKNPDVVCDVCNMAAFSAESFDFVIATALLEHVYNPQSAIREFYRVLRNKGKLLIHAVFMQPKHNDPCDYYRYTDSGISYLLSAAGFKIIECVPMFFVNGNTKAPEYYHVVAEKPCELI